MKISLGQNVLEEAVLESDEMILQRIRGKIFVFCGYPGSGKGTCGEIISKRLGVAHISTGDLFRAEVALNTPAGQEIASYMQKGQFVPPELANSILANRLAQEDAQRGVLLDGFPRSIEHLHDLDKILKPSNRHVEAAILLDIDEQVCIKRLSGRRNCPQCLQTYNIHSSPPKVFNHCDNCDTEIVQRTDDNEEIIKKRFDLAKSSLAPLLEELERRDILYTLNIFESPSLTPLIVANKVLEIFAYPDRFSNPSLHQSAYYRLSLHFERLLSFPPPSPSSSSPPSPHSQEGYHEDLMKSLCLSYRDQLLLHNSSKRTGLMRRFVYLSSENSQKYLEFIRVFDRYGIEVLRLPPLPSQIANWSSQIIFFLQLLLSTKNEFLIPLAILRESSLLLKPSSGSSSSLTNGQSNIFLLGKDQLLFNEKIFFEETSRSTGRDGVYADHLSILSSIWIPTSGSFMNQFCGKFYFHLTHGKIRKKSVTAQENSQIHILPVFGWDEEFILLETNESYHSHREKGLKISSRDMALSLFLQDRIYYKHFLNLKHTPLTIQRPVDFFVDVAVFVSNQEYYQTPLSRLYGLQNLLTHVLNEGIFFKGADTRLEANYWQPGLNAGLPLIAKKDPIHEKTFMFHDFGHFLMKDLIYTGVNTPLHRHVYIIHRMMSESITIMLADGLFVDSLQKSHINYDFSTRKIYPLFCSLWGSCVGEEQQIFPTFSNTGEPLHKNKKLFIQKLKLILKASVDYTVKGDDRSFKSLLQENLQKIVSSTDPSSSSNQAQILAQAQASLYQALTDYKFKYKPFFVSDFHWTVHNYENMSSRANEMRLWWELTQPVRDLFDLPLETIDEFIQHLSEENRKMNGQSSGPRTGGETGERTGGEAGAEGGEGGEGVDPLIDPIDGEVYLPTPHPLDGLIDNIFEIVFTRNIQPIFDQMDSEPLPLVPSELRLQRGFYRYIIGQMGVFARFWSIHESKAYLEELIHKLKSKESIEIIRNCYESYLELLLHKNLISQDDCHNFKDIYPLFEPFYVTYDDQKEAYPHLQELSHHLLSLSLYRHTQQKQMENFLKQQLNKKEVKFYQKMSLLIELSGGRIDEGVFVIEPGVALIAHTQFQLHEGINEENISHATFLLVGISLETSLEFIAHHEAAVARLTSSKTNAMNVPYYRVQETGDSHSSKMAAYLKLQQLIRSQYQLQEKPYETWTHGVELFNMTQSGCKSTAMMYTMAIKDFHKLFIGRMSESGNENEVRHVVQKMADLLHPLYPNQILSSSQYLSLSNGMKYNLTSLHSPMISSSLLTALSTNSCLLLSETTLTSHGNHIFNNLNVDMSGTQFEQIAEFSSRLTYLSFVDQTPLSQSSKRYLNKMIQEFQHRSIVSSIRVSFLLLLDLSAHQHYEIFHQSIWKVGGTITTLEMVEEKKRVGILTINLKALHVLFKEWSKTLPPLGIIQTMIQQAHERYEFAIDSYSVYYD